MSSKSFTFQADPKLAEVRAELAAIGDAKRVQRDAARRAREAADTLYMSEFQARFETAKASDVRAARDDLEAAQSALDAANALSEPKSEAVAYLRDLEKRLAREERERNIAEFRPVFAAALQDLDRALAGAATASEQLDELFGHAVSLGLAVPDTWASRLSRTSRRGSELIVWRRMAHEHGWLKPGPDWTTEHR